jgi:hypothetical protein
MIEMGPNMLYDVQIRAVGRPQEDINVISSNQVVTILAVCFGSLSCWK